MHKIHWLNKSFAQISFSFLNMCNTYLKRKIEKNRTILTRMFPDFYESKPLKRK